MRVVLAGFNVETAVLEEARTRLGEAVTPEVISASYARISRDPRSVVALRREARQAVEKARQLNERIVFGFGHTSVAEHAVLNIDLSGISRLAVEEIEHFRLASFTEKSQRYIRLGKDMVIPAEMTGARLEREFRSLVASLHRAYEEAFRRIAAAGEELGASKEDARYLMPLATATQLGMTVNARELELMVSRLAAHELDELRRFSRAMYRLTKRHIPSLVRYPRPSAHVVDAGRARLEIARFAAGREKGKGRRGERVRLVEVTPRADERLAASIVFSSRGGSFAEAERAVARLSSEERERLIRTTMRRLGPNDAVWREFESVALAYELVVSASCYAQLKRHRMATLLPQPYDPSLGISVPATFARGRSEELLARWAERAEGFYRANAARLGRAAEYALTNAHRRRVLFILNLRELYHFSRLRGDASAQWEIRELSEEMCTLASQAVPAGAWLLGGKDSFAAPGKLKSLMKNMK